MIITTSSKMWRYAIIAVLAEVVSGSIDAKNSCSFSQFECDSGHCLNIVKYCDGIKDCPDGSDEIKDEEGCMNVRNDVDLKCRLPPQYQCDSVHHCINKTDEDSCDTAFQMRCTWNGLCMNKLFLNCTDQPDWTCSDTIPCLDLVCSRYGVDKSSDSKQPQDLSEKCDTFPIFRCDDSAECLTAEKFCDGTVDCKDGSDERVMTVANKTEGIPCSNKWNNYNQHCHLPARYVCDGIDHCDHRVDECEEGCRSSFICKNGRCLPEALRPRCNGHDDCGDSSDELSQGARCEFKCTNGETTSKDKFCDGRNDCTDGSDEIQASSGMKNGTVCGSREQLSNRTCVVPDDNVCDDHGLCLNLEDESHCDSKKYFRCNNGAVKIWATTVCDFIDDCGDASDECNTPDGCRKTFTCENGMCIAFEFFCDGQDDCGDGSDEVNLTEHNDGLNCSNRHNNVEKKCRLPRKYHCDGLNHCENREDECASSCSESFFCDNGECIDEDMYCDGSTNCADNSDEKNSVVGFKCRSSRTESTNPSRCVVHQRLLFDNVTHCPHEEDNCSSGKCFRCLQKQFYISDSQVCDGIVDCPDLSDECMCLPQLQPAADVCKSYCTICTKYQDNKYQPSGISCDNGTQCISLEKVCDGVFDCSDRQDEKACDLMEQIYASERKDNFSCHPENKTAVPCDGVPQCRFGHDECGTLKENGTEKLMCGNYALDICKAMFELSLSPIVACPNKTETTLLGKLCDGKEDCDRENEQQLSIDERGCKNRWRCTRSNPIENGKVTIPIIKLCDGYIDCQDEDDEDEDLCKKSDPNRFYCENRRDGITNSKHGPLFVLKKQVLDGKTDCWDNSDECPKQQFENDPFSSSQRMIKNMVLVMMIWIMTILATTGNTAVIWHTISKFRSRRSHTCFMKSNYIVVVNLAVADFLMGIYLLSIGVKNAITSGSYCKYDREWRRSSECAGLGTLAMISLQASVLFLILLTTYRIKSILSPFSTDRMNAKRTCVLALLVWTFSTAMAVLPSMKYFEDYFVSSVHLSSGLPFFEDTLVTKGKMSDFVMKLQTYSGHFTFNDPSAELKWAEIRTLLKKFYPHDWPQFELQQYGYYSPHAVCLPTIFVQTTDASWGFSVAIVVFFLLSFLYVFVAYVLMYRDASRDKVIQRNQRAAKENRVLQSRITRLIVVDFLCLVPVCVISLASITGTKIDNVAYAVAATVLLPINSALNPLIYSNILEIMYSSVRPSLPPCISKILNRKYLTKDGDQRTSPSNRQSYSSYASSRSSRTTTDGGSCRSHSSFRHTSITSIGKRPSHSQEASKI